MNNWDALFKTINKKDYALRLHSFLDEQYQNYVVYPPRNLLFQAFHLTPPKEVKVVILGQDPYHQPNQAMGLVFSVPKTTRIPPSLINIFKEIEANYNFKMKPNGDLTYLARQGVLLLNVYLSVRHNEPLSHRLKEYELFTNDVLSYLNTLNQPIVYLLWGSFAKKYEQMLTNPHHLILKAHHPSPLSANRGGWFNNKHFLKTNEFLISKGVTPIDWQN